MRARPLAMLSLLLALLCGLAAVSSTAVAAPTASSRPHPIVAGADPAAVGHLIERVPRLLAESP